MQVFIFSLSVSSNDKLGLLRWVVVVLDFCCANDYAMTNNMYLSGIGSTRGWCWGLMMKIRKFEL
jgi:hypothetical protein